MLLRHQIFSERKSNLSVYIFLVIYYKIIMNTSHYQWNQETILKGVFNVSLFYTHRKETDCFNLGVYGF